MTAPDLSLADSAPAIAVSGQPYTYALTAADTRGAAATGVTVTGTLPASAHFTAASATQGLVHPHPATRPRPRTAPLPARSAP
jgi:uncharacterized repeat protein (TIGR01451 family)